MPTLLTSSFVERFRTQANGAPSSIAVMEAGAAAFTYEQLLATAAIIASRLTKAGVEPEEAVGIYIEKSADYIASLLACWFAGAAFVPLDPRLPAERISLIVREAGINRVLVRSPSEAAVGASAFNGQVSFVSCAVTPLEVEEIEQRERLRANAGIATAGSERQNSDALAYVIFTSGSTGEPKGVMVTHRGIVNLLDAQIEGFRLRGESRVLFYLSTNFDASISDIGTALLSGAALYIEPESSLKPGREFVDMLSARQITHMDIPPSLLSVLEPDEMPRSLETIVIGGEACAPQVVRRWASRFRLVNVYGPTEATVCTSFCVCDSDWVRPLLGRTISGIDYHVLDSTGRPVLPGGEGELFIGGIGLARGYLNKPDLTAAKFPQLAGERVYRTGDRVRLLANEAVEFIGRTDRQFKLRGLLIEPEEIEARLKTYAAVQNAAVLKRALAANSSREALVAFISLRPGCSCDSRQLRTYLTECLPAWMVPQHFEILSALPHTLTGKVDFASLTAVCLRRGSVANGSESKGENAPFGGGARACAQHSREAELLAGLWCQILSLEEIGLHDDFFAVGGDSFAVLELALAAEASGVTLSPALLMTNTTIAKQAQVLKARQQPEQALQSSGGMRCQSLREEMALSPQWSRLLQQAALRTCAPPRKPASALVTGAAGFLGSRLLHELLRASDARFVCLVRAADHDAALARIEGALARQGLTLPEAGRLTMLCADLSLPMFGLEQAQWLALAEEVDTVYHCAAQVNMLLPYESLRDANVIGTQEVLRFICAGRKKALHYASTLSVFVATDRNEGLLLESDRLDETEIVYGGYAQSKWAAEVFLRNCQIYLPAISFYRFGLITGDSANGATSDNDFLNMFVRGIATIGCVPERSQALAVDVTPIDFAASAMATIALSQQSKDLFETYHIANPVSLSMGALLAGIKECGVSLTTVAAEEFLARCQPANTAGVRSSGAATDRACAAARLALCRCLPGRHAFESYRTMDLFQATNTRFDMRNAQEALSESGLSCPLPSPKLIGRYIKQALRI